MSDAKDISLSGMGKIGGGVYGNVKVSGAGTVDGDVEAASISVSGAAKFTGLVKAETIKVSGSADLAGNVEAKDLSVSGSCHLRSDVKAETFKGSGSCKIDGNVQGKNLAISGSARIEGGVKGSEVRISGSIKIGKDLEAETARFSGIFEIGGLLNADQVEIEFGGHCRAREIGGTSIIVKRGDCGGFLRNLRNIGFLKTPMKFLDWDLQCDVIEGDDIALEATKAKTVRGKRVYIGEDCVIETVEYSERLEVDEKATVMNQIHTGA